MTQNIRDIVMSQSANLPSLDIEVEEIASLFGQRLVVEKQQIRKTEFLRYPYLFGEDSPLSKVWFDKLILPEVTNSFLYILENKLQDPYENFEPLDEAFSPDEWEILILQAKKPVSLIPAFIHGHDTAVRCG